MTQQGFFDHQPIVQNNFQGGRAGLIFGLEPNHIGRLSSDQRELFKIGVASDDDKVVVFRSLPDHTIGR